MLPSAATIGILELALNIVQLLTNYNFLQFPMWRQQFSYEQKETHASFLMEKITRLDMSVDFQLFKHWFEGKVE